MTEQTPIARLSQNKTFSLMLDISIIYFLSLLFFQHYQFQSAFLPGTDGYFHIKYAYLLRTEGFMANFRWATLSLWHQAFSDKEFLYHLFLIPFTYFEDLQRGMKYATTILAAATITSFYVILVLNKVRHAWFWYGLLCSAGGYFLYRANVPRPQVLSITLALWSIHFILNKQRLALGILCFFYTTAYTAFLLPLIFALIASTNLFIFEKERDWKTPATALGALLAGMIIHPYFPNNFKMFYLQNFYVLWMGIKGSVDLHMGGELKPMTTRKLIEVNTSVVIPYFMAFFTSLYQPPKTDAKTRSLFLISLSLLTLTAMSKRFGEYSVPVTLLFCALFFAPYLNQFDPIAYWKKETWSATTSGVLLAAIVALLFYRSYQDVAPQFLVTESRYKSAALYLKSHAPKDQVVFTCDWDDAPDLFYYNHNNRYLVFLDPNFMYFWNDAIWKKWDRVAHGRFGTNTYDILKNDFKITYGVCTSNFSRLKNIIVRDPKMQIVHQTAKTYVFKLEE